MTTNIIAPDLLNQSLLFARLSEAAYRDQSITADPELHKLKNEFRLNAGNTGNATETQALLGRWNNDIVIAFRGTEKKFSDWWTDLNGQLVASRVHAGRVHTGFETAAESVFDPLRRFIKNHASEGSRIFLCGHSLGGALALLTANRLAADVSLPTVRGVFTYGAPRVGDGGFAEAYRRTPSGPFTTMWVSLGDPVARIAPHVMDYRHAGARQFNLDRGSIGVVDLDGLEALRTEQDWFLDSPAGRTARWLTDRVHEVFRKLNADEHSIRDSYVQQLQVAKQRRDAASN